MNEGIVMYGCSASLGNESMNCTNHRARQHIAIDLVNVTMDLLKHESGQFARKKELAWGTEDALNPKGKDKHEEVIKDVQLHDYIVETNKMRLQGEENGSDISREDNCYLSCGRSDGF